MTITELTQAAAAKLIDAKVARASNVIWTISSEGKLVLIAGVSRSHFLGETEFWLVRGPYFHEYRWKVLRAMPKLYTWLRSQYAKLFVRAEPESERLAEFIGMRFVGWDIWPDGRKWKRYEP